MSVHIPWHSTDKWWESLTLGKQPKALLLFPVRPAVHLDIPSWACSQCISVPPLGIITLVLSSPLLLPPPHLTLPTCNCGIFSFLGRAVWSTQESLWSVLYWKASSITCKEKNLYHLWNFNICIHNLIQFVWLISGSICFAEMFSSSDYCESFVSFFQFPTYFPPVSASTNIDLWLIL